MTSPVFYAPYVTVAGAQGADPVPLRAALTQSGGDRDRTPTQRTVEVRGEEAKHAVRVQRLRPGTNVDLVDGSGFRAKGVVAQDVPRTKTASKDDPVLRVEVLQAQQDPPSKPRLTLVQALAKNGRDEQAIETATELGVDSVVPWQAERCIVRWDPRKKPVRWQRILLAAMKQSRRSVLPTLDPAVTTAELAQSVADEVGRGALVLVCHESAARSFSQVLKAQGVADQPAVTVIVGPEGGITEAELGVLTEAGAQAVLLGPHVLRSSTAGPAALAAINLAAANW